MIVLVTNDDGIYSPGLAALAEALSELGQVVVVAPDREQSACSHALTMHRPLRIEEVRPRTFAVDGTPADCVNIAVNGGLAGGRPGLVASGINLGANLGDDVTYSGTIAGAQEAAILGIPAIAVSLNARRDFHFDTATLHAVRLARSLLADPGPERVFYSLNVPNVAPGAVREVRWTRLGRRVYHDALDRRVDPRGRAYFWIGGMEPGFRDEPGTDMRAVADGCVSITPLRLDRTHDERLAALLAARVTP
jgi:5'-nucleotidase